MSERPSVADLNRRLAALSPERRAALEQAMRARAVSLPPELAAPAARAAAEPGRRRRPTSRMAFSLFFFSGDGSTQDGEKYRLLLDCARFADERGFAAVWVPERHFVDFGGLYPNPSLLAAALAVTTRRVQLRAGSVVLPLHHPVRVAEEWAVVDNLSGGRAAISAASGWHPDDFVLAPGGPDGFPRRKDAMFEAIETVQRLWAGETIDVSRPDGSVRAVRTLPRPLQPKLPVWVSAAGSVETFERAGAIGANVLTGVIGHRLVDLGEKITAYRAARAAGGHDPAAGTVTAMVHTFLGTSDEEVRGLVREPLIDYLGTFLRQHQGIEGGFGALDDDARAAMLDATFERYFQSLALLGTPDKCEALVEDLVDVGVDEVACLVDFGLSPDTVRDGLRHLADLRDRYQSSEGPTDE
ncbi:MupA/Atu3671 family FMN-dependent luciferase-like monooxygenase [Micromonospora echinospora]